MPNKKAEESSPEEQALEQRVKAIMEGGQTEPAPPASTPQASTPPAQPPEIDIFSDPKTAPAVPKELLKKIGAVTEAKSRTETKTASAAAPTAATTPTAATPDSATVTTESSEAEPLDDGATEKAVDEIVATESDALLAAEDAARDQANKTSNKTVGHKFSLRRLFKSKWSWLLLVVVLTGVLAYPSTRYKVLGVVLKEPLKLTVMDSKTNTPVSNATVTFEGKTAKTDAGGKVVLQVPPGGGTLVVTKQYYKTWTQPQTIGLGTRGVTIQLVATGRQVPITVRNRITGKPLSNAEISILDTTAKTNQQGLATIVLPTSSASDNATINLSGYNSAHATIAVTSSIVDSNTLYLTPAGHVYFLSNLSGTLDVVKAYLDGTGRQTVFKGTGKEDPNTTSLLASRDWRYLVLKAQRDGTTPALYLIDTNGDKVTQFDNGNADFTLIGWYNHYFMYDVAHNAVPAWQGGHETLKSYNAENGQPQLLDQSQAEGNASSYAYQGFYNFYTLNDLLVYNTQWYTYNANGTGYDLSGKSDTIRAVQPNGQAKKDYQSITASGLGYIQAALFEPQGIYYAAFNYSTNAPVYYKFENGSATAIGALDQTVFNQAYPTYLVSPSGSQTFWSEVRDGQNSLFVGNPPGNNQQQIASLNDYAPYGWYTDNYLLVSKNSSELYIMPVTGLSGTQQPLKITDYFKPTQTYNGYGYGYGGL